MPSLTCDGPVLYNKGSGIGDAEHGIALFPLSKDLILQGAWVTSLRGVRANPRRRRPATQPLRRRERTSGGVCLSEVGRLYGAGQ